MTFDINNIISELLLLNKIDHNNIKGQGTELEHFSLFSLHFHSCMYSIDLYLLWVENLYHMTEFLTNSLCTLSLLNSQ